MDLFRDEPLHDAGVGLALIVLLGGAVTLAVRLRAAWNRREPISSLQVPRMVAVLGALGAYVAYLRDLGSGHRSRDLTLAGLSALPWALVIGLELGRRWLRRLRR
jgi:hypothetical protein